MILLLVMATFLLHIQTLLFWCAYKINVQTV